MSSRLLKAPAKQREQRLALDEWQELRPAIRRQYEQLDPEIGKAWSRRRALWKNCLGNKIFLSSFSALARGSQAPAGVA
jgi:hypothetical protein